MKHPMHNRIISFLLALVLFFGYLPVPSISAELQGQSVEKMFSENVGKQAIFDWWSEFLLVRDPSVDGVYDIGTNWYSYDFLGAENLVVSLIDYYYDEENGFVWYKVGGDNLPAMLKACPWVLYCMESDVEMGVDPYLAIYEADDTIRFVNTTYSAGDGTQVSTTFVLSGPAALADADISITHNADLEYSTSAMSHYDSESGESWYCGFDVSVMLDENVWTAENGAIAIRYVASIFGSNTYAQSLYYGGAFILEDDVTVSGVATDLTGLDASDLVTTTTGNCTMVLELLCESFAEMDAQGYFSGSSVSLYSTAVDASVDYVAPAPPEKVTVVGSFTAYDRDWYWLAWDETPERGYFLVPAENITFADVAYIYWYLVETVSKEGYTETEEKFAEDLAQFTFSAAQQADLQEHLDLIPYRADMVYTPWSGRIGPLMPPVTVNETASAYSLRTASINGISRFSAGVNGGIMPMAEAEDTNNNGLELSKKVVDNPDDTYTITIEAYTTGEVTVVTKKTAVDVILVLDLSRSMDTEDVTTVATYTALISGTAQSVYETYDTVYVKVDDTYKTVTISGTGGTSTSTYSEYNGDYKVSNLYDYVNNGNKLYYKVDTNYYPVSITRTGNNKYKYSVTYNKGTQDVTLRSNLEAHDQLNNYTFYTMKTVATYTSYTYSYQDASGNTVTNTYEPSESVVGGDITYYYASSTDTVKRIEALQSAVTNFTTQIIAAAQKDGVNHRVSIITFNRAHSSTEKSTDVQCGLTDVSTETGASTVQTAASNLTDHQNSNTRADLGLSAAIDVFSGTTTTYSFTNDDVGDTTSRQRVVLFFTDGYPADSQNEFDADIARDAIEKAYALKNTYGATVYSVAILADADPGYEFTKNEDDDIIITEGTSNNPSKDLVNGYLHAVSSNYPNATATGSVTITMGDGGNNDYYLTASSTDDLNKIFDTVSNVVVSGGSSADLSTETTVKDIVTPQFIVPEDTTGINVYQVDCDGYENGVPKWSDDTKVLLSGTDGDQKIVGTYTDADGNEKDMVTITNGTVDVKGFDFNHNFVAETGRLEGDTTQTGNFYGRKLVIEFNITADGDFLGGANVPTNGDYSGLYNDSGVPIEYLPQPTYNFDLKKISTVVQDRHIYYGNTVNMADILNLVVYIHDEKGGTVDARADGENNQYVNLVYTIKLGGEEVATYTIEAGEKWENGVWRDLTQTNIDWSKLSIRENTTYSVECVMRDINPRTDEVGREYYDSRTADGEATIYVYKPTVTFKDSEYQYLSALDTYTSVDTFLLNHYVAAETTWTTVKNGDTVYSTDPSVIMQEEKPDFTFTYSYDSNAFKDSDNDGVLNMNSNEDVPVTVTAYINGTDKSNAYSVDSFVHTCSFGCGTNSEARFIVHVKTANILITKSGMQEGDSAYFEIRGSNDSILYVTIHGNDSILIKNVIKGVIYTVTELTSWSWEYTCETYTRSVNVVNYDTYVVSFENTYSDSDWLEGETSVDNIFE